MICQNCRNNDALYERYIDTGLGGMVEIHVCQECARKLDFVQKNKNEKLFSVVGDKQKRCPECGTKLDIFVKSNYVGCAKCYEVFAGEIDTAIKNYHGKNVHVGKIPEQKLNNSRNEDYDLYAKKMERAINECDGKSAEKIRRDFFGKGGSI